MNFRETKFYRTFRASAAELFDELMVFISFLIAIVTGLYFKSWIVFFAVLVAGFVLATILYRLITKTN